MSDWRLLERLAMLRHVETLYLALLVHAQRNQELDYLEQDEAHGSRPHNDRHDGIELEYLMADEDVVITVSHSGFQKRAPLSVSRKQGSGGKRRMGIKTRHEDF